MVKKFASDQIRCILFDFDGTISDSHDAALDTYNSLSKKYGFRTVLETDLPSLKHKTSKELLKHLGISLMRLPFILKEARANFQKQIHDLQPIEDLTEVLIKLKELKLQLGILTSNSGKNVSDFLSNNKLNYFDYIYPDVHLFGKSRAIKRLIKKEKLKSERVVYVGDETRDIEAAKTAGVGVIAVTWGFNSREVLQAQGPSKIVDSPQELLDLFSA